MAKLEQKSQTTEQQQEDNTQHVTETSQENTQMETEQLEQIPHGATVQQKSKDDKTQVRTKLNF